MDAPDVRPAVWVSHRYGAQMGWAKTDHQVCLAHLIRDAQYAIDAGDIAFAPACKTCCSGPARSAAAGRGSPTPPGRPTAQGSTPNSMRCSTSSRPTRPAKS